MENSQTDNQTLGGAVESDASSTPIPESNLAGSTDAHRDSPGLSPDAEASVSSSAAADEAAAAAPAAPTLEVLEQAADQISAGADAAAVEASVPTPEAPVAQPTEPTVAAEVAAPAPAGEGRQPSMAQIMESDEFSSYLSGADTLEKNQLLEGTVVRIDDNTGEVLVDVNTKSEGIIGKNEVGDDPISVGDRILVVVVRPEDDEGHPILSKRRADFERRWRELAQVRDANEVIEGTVRDQVKGGLIIDLGVSAFIPASHVDSRNRGDLSRFVGRTIPSASSRSTARRTRSSPRTGSRPKKTARSARKKSGRRCRRTRRSRGSCAASPTSAPSSTWAALTACCTSARWRGAASTTRERRQARQKLQVLILDIDRENKRVALGLKQLQPDPWKKAAKNLKVGEMVKGKITASPRPSLHGARGRP
jgi:4-hydroxy-3-methylbut-2-enyl diphosphate reductase